MIIVNLQNFAQKVKTYAKKVKECKEPLPIMQKKAKTDAKDFA